MSHKIERDYNEKGEDIKTEKKNGKVDNVTTFASNVLMSSWLTSSMFKLSNNSLKFFWRNKQK